MSRILLFAGMLCIAALALVISFLPRQQVPMSLFGAGQSTYEQLHRDFSTSEISRNHDLHDTIRPWQLLRLALSVLAPFALLYWATRSGTVQVIGPQHIRWWFNSFMWLVMLRAISLPSDFAIRRALYKVGLTHQDMQSWLSDLAKSFFLATLITLVIVAGLTRWSYRITDARIVAVTVLAAVITCIFSYLIPVVVEPMFNNFSSLENGPLRTSLMALAKSSGVRVNDILVVDASRRTPAMNAYVSGIGSSRRVVVYDNLINNAPPQEVEVIVAHELGHVAHNDVLKGTVLSAVLAAIGGLCLLAVLGTGRFIGKEIIAVAAFMAIASVILSVPFNAFSRQIEAHADEFAIEQTHTSLGLDAFTIMQKRMAVMNYSDLMPHQLMYVMFSTHPTAVERIAFARNMAQFNAWPIPRDLVDVDIK